MRIRMVLGALFFLGLALYFKNLAAFRATLGSSVSLDRVPGSGVTRGGSPRSPAWAGLVSWQLPGG
jgi:hypothetical protein